MKNIKKKVMTMMFAAMTLMSFSAFAADAAYNYSENGDFAAAVVDIVPQTEIAMNIMAILKMAILQQL